MLSQFSKEGEHSTLSDLYKFPKDVYPVGRLDADSEGLLILTDDKKLNNFLLNPDFKHQRTYWVQVEGAITVDATSQLEKGVTIKVDKVFYQTFPCKTEIIDTPNNLAERNPPIRFRKNIPTSWVKIILAEGKNRQVRKMTARVGFPTLRLIRIAIEEIELGEMKAGEVKELAKDFIYSRLHIS